jgi:predicted metal-binding membrane protein
VIYNPREVARVSTPVLLIAGSAWALLIAGPRALNTSIHCAAIDSGAAPLSTALPMLLAMNFTASLTLGWVLMFAAMMLPALIQPIYHVYQRSFSRRRLRSIGFFLTGYGVVWIVAGVALLLIDVSMKVIALTSYYPVIAAFVFAMVWQFSPIKQRSLNRCHAHSALAAFGVASDFSAFLFGVRHGIWCVCSCWAWMLCVMLLSRGHLLGMAVVTVLVFSERLEKPQVPAWRPRGLAKVTRILRAQCARAFTP